MEYFQEKSLKSLGCRLLSGYAFKSADYQTRGIPLIKIGNIQNRDVRIDENGTFIDESLFNAKVDKYLLNEGDILISMTGQGSVGRVGKLKLDGTKRPLLNQRVGKIICDEENAHLEYLYYILTSDKYQNLLFHTGSGSGQPNLSPELILSIKVPAPAYAVQKNIASVLLALDDKIDFLHRQNKTLEAMAETLFRQWFVEEAEESWELGKLDDIVTVKGGTTPSTVIPEYWNGDVAWTTPKDLSERKDIYLFNTERKISELGLARIGTGLMPIGTVLLSSRAPIGYLAISEIPVAINQGYIAMVCDKGFSNYFVFLWCKANLEEIKNAGNGSVFQEISKTTFKQLSILMPHAAKLGDFDAVIGPVFQRIKHNQAQSALLTDIRETLLPKLMNGQMSVS